MGYLGIFSYGFVFQKDTYDLLCPGAAWRHYNLFMPLKNVPPILRQCEQYLIYILTQFNK
jgi:hypothetical protein